MFEKLETCPSCNKSSFRNYLIANDCSISGESFALVQCDYCELIFTNPRPSSDNIGKYYDSEEYISHSNKTTSIVGFVYKIIRAFTLRKKEGLIHSLASSRNSLLDYGSGTGHFLDHCSKKGWSVTGIEPSQQARDMTPKRIKSNIHQNLSTVTGSFDIITAWHVIEHVHDLIDTIKKLKKLLSPEGHLIIAVPNIESLDAKEYRDHWAALDVPRHLYHFSTQSMSNLISKNKMTIEKILPMPFDSYYVSLLSEKYLGSTNQLTKAISAGYKSNRSAKTTGQYSSLIYVISK